MFQLGTAFHGFSPHEVEKAAQAAKDQKTKVLAEYEDCGLSENCKDVVKVVLDPPQPETFENDPSLLPWIEVARRNYALLQSSATETALSLNSKYKYVLPCLKLFISFSNLFFFSIITVGSTRNSVPLNHSSLSSRAAKPNKRFLDLEESFSVDQKDSHSQNKHLRTIELKKPRLILHDIKSVVTSGSCVSNQSDSNLFRAFISSGSITESSDKCHWKVCDKVQGGLSDLNVFGASVSQPCFHSIKSAKKNDFIESDYFTLSSKTLGMFDNMGASVGHNQKFSVPRKNSSGTASPPERLSEGTLASQSKKRSGMPSLFIFLHLLPLPSL